MSHKYHDILLTTELYQYTDWPELKHPGTSTALLGLIEKVDKVKGGPITVVCK